MGQANSASSSLTVPDGWGASLVFSRDPPKPNQTPRRRGEFLPKKDWSEIIFFLGGLERDL